MNKNLKARVLPVKTLKESQFTEMFHLFEAFYEDVAFERFCLDLKSKSQIILMLNHIGQIKGFSSVTDYEVKINQKTYRILYSGDTIISPDHWGTTVLVSTFTAHMMKLKLKNPHKEVWWFLLSKGYKTYLLLANNFLHYYPRMEESIPQEYRDLRAHLANLIYPGHYNNETGLLKFDRGEHEHLKHHVAPITEEMMIKKPKIRFFQEQNPEWEKGDELVCLGKIEFRLWFFIPVRSVLKKFFR